MCTSSISIKGEHFPCDMMDSMRRVDPSAINHDGWAHANKEAEAVWTNDVIKVLSLRSKLGVWIRWRFGA